MKKGFVIPALLLVFSLLAACAPTDGTGGPSTTLRIDMSEFVFIPANVSVPAGQQITVDLKNSGSIEHDFIILKKGVVVQGKFDHEKQMDDVYFHAELDSGKADEFTFTAPTEPGTYVVVCGIAGHFQAGMTGTLTVVATSE
jgi:uncharacterized cupredoxin-like copper-binding protein